MMRPQRLPVQAQALERSRDERLHEHVVLRQGVLIGLLGCSATFVPLNWLAAISGENFVGPPEPPTVNSCLLIRSHGASALLNSCAIDAGASAF